MSSALYNSNCPLPPGWTKGYSNSQKRPYYVHAKTKHTQWHFPTASEAADPLKAKRRAELNKKRQASSEQAGLGTIVSKIEVTPAKQAKRSPTTSVAIIVPYRDPHKGKKSKQHLDETRDREKQLAKFVPHMHKFLGSLIKQKKLSDYHIYIVEQSDDGRKFNRGKLLNIGFKEATNSGRNHSAFIFHDVDLLPQEDLGEWYAKYPKVPIHIARVWNRYSKDNKNYFGGVVSINYYDYVDCINGFPNTFWGWGGEDDAMQRRMKILGMKWECPTRGTLVDLERMNLGEKLGFLGSNPALKFMRKREALKDDAKTWKTNGLNSLSYAPPVTMDLDDTKKASKITVDVQLNGNHWTNKHSDENLTN